MKRDTLTKFTGVALLVTVLAAAATPAMANPQSSTTAQAALKAVPAPEIPAKAAELVRQALPADRAATALAVIEAANQLNPNALPATVGAIAKTSPDLAATVAGAAVKLQPKMAAAISKAAAAAAKGKADEIAAAVVVALPDQFNTLAIAVAEGAPAAGKEIVTAVANALPAISSMVEATSSQIVSTPSASTFVADIMNRVSGQVDVIAQQRGVSKSEVLSLAQPPPTNVRGPFQPLPGSVTTITRSQTTVVPAGSGRQYSR